MPRFTSEIMKEKWKNPEFKKKMSLRGTTKGYKNPHSEEWKKNMAILFKGEKNPFFGRIHNDDTKKRISQKVRAYYDSGGKASYGTLGKHASKETIKKRSLKLKGRPCSKETKAKISSALKGRSISLEQKTKISNTLKLKFKLGILKPHLLGKKNPAFAERYGKKDEFEKKRFAAMNILPTKPEKRFVEICKKYQLPFKYVGDGQFVVFGLNPDFIEIKGEKMAIEIFSSYYHSKRNPRVRPSQLPNIRKAIFCSHSWKIAIFWDNEIMSDKAEKTVLDRLISEGMLQTPLATGRGF